MAEEYSKQELTDYALLLEDKLAKLEKKNNPMSRSRSNSSNDQQNMLVEWQLNLDKEFELIHHQLRGHVIKRRESDDTEYWAESDDKEQSLLNEKGAQEVEKVIRNYLNKNLLLSDFTEAEINQRMFSFAERIRRFIYLNYEEFGLTTYYKQKHFEMLVMGIVDMVEAAYHRAKDGAERQSLTTIRSIIQQESVDNTRPQLPSLASGQKRGFFGRMFGR